MAFIYHLISSLIQFNDGSWISLHLSFKGLVLLQLPLKGKHQRMWLRFGARTPPHSPALRFKGYFMHIQDWQTNNKTAQLKSVVSCVWQVDSNIPVLVISFLCLLLHMTLFKPLRICQLVLPTQAYFLQKTFFFVERISDNSHLFTELRHPTNSRIKQSWFHTTLHWGTFSMLM